MELPSEWIQYIKHWANVLPIETFVFVGSIIEEIIGPIPSPLVMVTAGSIAQLNDRSYLYLLYIALIATIGKLIASLILYWCGDKGEDIVVNKFGKYMGVTHKEVESFGARFNGGLKDHLILFSLRAIPIFPSGAVSLACGVIRINIRLFILQTFLGITVRSLIYLYIGYTGLAILNDLSSFETYFKISIAIGSIGILCYFIYRRYANKTK